MDIYTRSTRWKLSLAFIGLVIVTISLIYTNYLTNKLAVEEKNKANIYAMAQEALTLDLSTDSSAIDCDVTFHQNVVFSNKTIPCILVNDRGGIDGAINYGEEKDNDDEFLKQRVEKIKESGTQPIQLGQGVLLYYEESVILTQLRYYPIIQLILIMAFIIFGYLMFNATRKEEQNHVWVGMAKETAHQLGTPITAIIGWLDHLKDSHADDEYLQDILDELNNDVNRLNLVADRFSKIGSTPKLDRANIYEELEVCREYMQRRSSRKIVYEFPKGDHLPLFVNINRHLFAWVVENLIRNALDAMGGTGKISANIYQEKGYICVNVSDTGKGISSSKLKTVFRPGFTTKKRGWGLGLSLAKRIIETYHLGKIFVAHSIPNKDTTFTIKLPRG